jgi:dihydrofolate synthase / folylpolyglutamate synthase
MSFTYSQALDYIHSFDDPYLAAIRDHGKQTWGLAKIEKLLTTLGNPQLSYPSIHVAGTKGKGSTSAFIAQGLMESGLKVGLYISPHLEDWRERIQIDRHLISKPALARLASDVVPFAGQVAGLSAFEVTTALALWYFAREQVYAAVIEVGLGGRLDATNVLDPLVSVITNISLDHTQLLGTTLAEIAGEKAAIIKPGRPVVSAPQPDEVDAVIARQAEKMGSPLIVVGRDWRFEIDDASLSGTTARIGNEQITTTYHIGPAGLVQVENAAVAVATLNEARRAGLEVTDEASAAGLANTKWPGRFEIMRMEPLIIIDGAHNPYSVGRLVESLVALAPGRDMSFVFGCMADKDIEGMLKPILPIAKRLIFTQAQTERAAEVEHLCAASQKVMQEFNQGVTSPTVSPQITLAGDVPAAIDAGLGMLPDGSILIITGSLAIAGEARTALNSLARDGIRPIEPSVVKNERVIESE